MLVTQLTPFCGFQNPILVNYFRALVILEQAGLVMMILYNWIN